MTPTQPSQAVEAAERKIDLILSDPETNLSHGSRRALLWLRMHVASAELTRPLDTPSNSEAADARREIGKWLNEEQTKPVDRAALAQLCAGFDALARPLEVAEPVGISRTEWIAQAKAFYVESGDDDATARECARYICNQQDWAGGELGDPREEAQEDIHGRGRVGLAALAASRLPVASPAEPMIDCDTCGQRVTGPCNSVDCTVPDTPPGGAGGSVGAQPAYDTRQFSNLSNQAHGFAQPVQPRGKA